MKICVDTTVLIDILKDEFPDSQERLYSALSKGEALVIPTVVYAELMPQFKGDTRLLNRFLDEHRIGVQALGIDAVTAAAAGWMKYLKRKKRITCPECGKLLNLKEHFLSDFYIGGFALVGCSAILTRDRGLYRRYFPGLAGYDGCLDAA